MAGKPTHGDSHRNRHPLYDVWRNMKARCYYRGWPQFKDWGGRGIRVCLQWRHDYPAFKSWALVNGYEAGLTLDRIDNDGNYEPDNCRWVEHRVNCRNRRTKRLVTAFGETKSLAEWVDDPKCEVQYTTLFYRLFRHGWLPEQAIVSPAR